MDTIEKFFAGLEDCEIEEDDEQLFQDMLDEMA